MKTECSGVFILLLFALPKLALQFETQSVLQAV
jgi:hypothetical protein